MWGATRVAAMGVPDSIDLTLFCCRWTAGVGRNRFARVWTWLAVLVGLVVLAGVIRRSRPVLFPSA